MKVIVNGELVDIDKSGINEKGWLIGNGIFESIKTVDGLPWALSRHMRRAINTAISIGLKLPPEDFVRQSLKLLLTQEHHPRGFIRLSFAANGKWAAVHLPYVEISAPAKLLTYPQALVIDRKPIKSYPYTHRLEILDAVKKRGYDEAIVTNGDGKVCEGAVTNLLLKIEDQWITPPLSDGVLPGVVRALVIENCGVKVRSIEIFEIVNIESAFLLSSLRIAQPVAAIDGRELMQSNEFRLEIAAMALRSSVG